MYFLLYFLSRALIKKKRISSGTFYVKRVVMCIIWLGMLGCLPLAPIFSIIVLREITKKTKELSSNTRDKKRNISPRRKKCKQFCTHTHTLLLRHYLRLNCAAHDKKNVSNEGKKGKNEIIREKNSLFGRMLYVLLGCLWLCSINSESLGMLVVFLFALFSFSYYMDTHLILVGTRATKKIAWSDKTMECIAKRTYYRKQIQSDTLHHWFSFALFLVSHM